MAKTKTVKTHKRQSLTFLLLVFDVMLFVLAVFILNAKLSTIPLS